MQSTKINKNCKLHFAKLQKNCKVQLSKWAMCCKSVKKILRKWNISAPKFKFKMQLQ